MAQSVELVLDDDLDAAVRGQWQALAEGGLPSQAAHPGRSNRPHVTLAAAAARWAPDVEAAIAAAAGPLPLAVRLGGLVVLPHGSRCVLARLVLPSAALLALHAGITGAAGGPPAGDPLPHLAPGEWTPHVTLARAVPTARLGEAVAALDEVTDLVGSGVRVRRWDGDARQEWTIAGRGAA